MMISDQAREAAWLLRPAACLGSDKTKWMAGKYDFLPVVQIIQSVIDAERERCAGIAKSFDDSARDNPYSEAARVIAVAIRGTSDG